MPVLLLVIILGIVEGVTEYLPVSSTGHLILATELLGFDADAWAVFNIAIQPGAILAIVVLYWRTFWDVFTGLFRAAPDAIAFVRNVLVAFLPAVVLGLALGNWIELLLGNAVVVAWALIIGGFAILVVERYARPTECGGVSAVSLRQSALIGLGVPQASLSTRALGPDVPVATNDTPAGRQMNRRVEVVFANDYAGI